MKPEFPAFLPTTRSTSSAILKGGLIGFGAAATAMYEVIRTHFPDVCISRVCDPDERRLAVASGEFGIEGCFQEVDALCAEPLDFVMVMSSNFAHAGNVEVAAARGMAVFCEKPMALDISHADAMIEQVERAGVVNYVNYTQRFNPAFLKVRGLCDEGVVGEIHAVACNRFRGYGLFAGAGGHPAVLNPDASGGWLIHHTCHAIDMIYCLAGEFEAVTARTHSTHPRQGSPEVIWGFGALKGGGTAVVGDSVGVAKHEQLVVQGSRGQLLLDHPDRETARIRVYREVECRESREAGRRYGPEVITVPDASIKPRTEILSHFFDCVRSGSPTACSFREARHSLAVVSAMSVAARTGGFVCVPGMGESLEEQGL